MEQKVVRYVKLLQVGQIITSEMNLEALFPLIIQHTNGIMNTQASSIFLYDKKSNELWAFEIDFESTRCSHIPEDIDECLGRISLCQFIGNRSDCFASGTIFSLRIPLKKGVEDVFK